eukprot:CAMPEP_0202872828 /NCGR_PEP_ID=MMETSP1391-20130828/22109_1 /ASSEMBLY_ACC=CAM_ASM_000867 /TAXON_ID=1034604 /ORGANISM="Chlamydomonas leiostraca, Strain SAG 11-49" /LENGTH=394 /DNA_ID=CAMNT_0049553967 /DNA_START=468 /DNA_END=1652 /DNA_ORIENTATION=-
MVFACLLPVLSFLFLFLTACRDPGIIPRQEPDEEYLMGRKPRTKDVLVNGHKVVIRYNDTCHFYQPPRAHHCSVNDNCIERFDHHCPWVGTTIGKRNYRSFLLFVYTTTVLCLYVFGCCLAQLFVRHNELVDDAKAEGKSGDGLWGKTIGDVIPAIVLMAYTFLFFWFVGGLSGFHCYLVGTNQTTYENFRYNHDNRPNPYDRGLFSNCTEVWCTPIPPSQVAFRAYIDEVGPGGGGLQANSAPEQQAVQAGDGEAGNGHEGSSEGQYGAHSSYSHVQQQAGPPAASQGQQQFQPGQHWPGYPGGTPGYVPPQPAYGQQPQQAPYAVQQQQPPYAQQYSPQHSQHAMQQQQAVYGTPATIASPSGAQANSMSEAGQGSPAYRQGNPVVSGPGPV